MSFQECWTTNRDQKVHVTFDGRKTPCELYAFEARPTYDSKVERVTCHTCGAYVSYDMGELWRAAMGHLEGHAGTAAWDYLTRTDFANTVVEQVGGLAFELRAEKPGSNRVFSEYMARGGWMTDKSNEARLIGTTALAVLAVIYPQS